MDATTLADFTDLLIDDLTVGPLSTLLDQPRPALDDDAVAALMVGAVRLRNVADYLIAQTVVAAERLAIPARRHLKKSSDLLAALGVAPAAAYRAARVGHASAALPTVARDLREGALSIEHADAIVKGVGHIGKRIDLDDDQRAAVVTKLTVQTTPAAIDTRARAIAIELAPAPEGAAADYIPPAENHALNDMTLHQNDEGRVVGEFDLDVLSGEELHAALDPLCKPVPLPDGSPDPRSASRRRGEALGQIVRTYLAGAQRPSSGGVLPHVTLLRPAGVWLSASVHTGSPVSADPVADVTGNDVDVLGFTGPVTAATADLVGCDAVLTDIHIDQNGAPLDVGRTARLFPPKLRHALNARDHGCAFPGCGRPAQWCDAHHIVHWSKGGTTCVDNGVLLCRMHHTVVHHEGWEVFLGRDRHPWFLPPIDPEHPNRHREPICSHARRTLTNLPRAC